jgi:hypothetical protein
MSGHYHSLINTQADEVSAGSHSHSTEVQPALLGIRANLPAPVIIRRPPFANGFHWTPAALANLLLIEPTHADAGRRHCRADIAEQGFRRFDRR